MLFKKSLAHTYPLKAVRWLNANIYKYKPEESKLAEKVHGVKQHRICP